MILLSLILILSNNFILMFVIYLSMSQEPFKHMEGTTVFDENEVKLGKIYDFIFNKEFKLLYFVMEPELRLIRDQISKINEKISYLIPKDIIVKREGNMVYINKNFDELKPIYGEKCEEGLLFGVIRYSEVIDSNYDNIGKIIDAIFHADDEVSFIIGGGLFKEFLKTIGITPNMHLLCPHRYIKEYKSNKIVISKSKDELSKMLNNAPLDEIGSMLDEMQKSVSRDADMILHRDKVFIR